MTDREKPFCRICHMRRLPQRWSVIDRARRNHDPMPTCSKNCARVAEARRMLRAQHVLVMGDRYGFAQPATPPRRQPSREFAGEGILQIIARPDWEERLAEEVSLNRAAAAEWMA